MRPETKQLLKNLSVGFFLLSTLGLFVWGVWHVVRLPGFTINQVVVSGGETIPHDKIVTKIDELLDTTYWKIIPKRFILAYPQQEITDLVQNTPRVRTSTLMRDEKNLMIELTEYVPVALWCDDEKDVAPRCVFLDETGYGFDESLSLQGGAFTRFIKTDALATTSVSFVKTEDFEELQKIDSLLSDMNWPTRQIEIDSARDLFIDLAGGGELKTTLRMTAQKTHDNLRTILADDTYRHLKPGNFEYIDLRFGNKIFVNEFGAPSEDDLIVPEGIETSIEIE